MLTSAFVISLLASAATLGSALPTARPISPAATTPCATTSTALTTSSPVPIDDDQPKPYVSVQIPVSELFDPLKAPAFSLTLGFPGPVYSTSTLCSSSAQNTEAPIASPATFSTTFSTSIPTELLSEVPARSQPPPAATFSDLFSTTIPVELSTQTPIATAAPSSTTCTENKSASITTVPSPSATKTPTSEQGAPILGPSNTPSRPSGVHPVGTGRPAPPSFVRPSVRRPNYPGYPRPTGNLFHPRPSASPKPKKQGAGAGRDKVSSTSCTLETRVRPSATAGVY